MAIERELRRLLEYARLPLDEGDQHKSVSGKPSNQDGSHAPAARVAAKTIYERLQRVCHQQTLPSIKISTTCNIPELLVLVAEAALYQQDFETAHACVAWFLSDWSAKNQFYCRMQLVRAQCASMDAAVDTGAVRLRNVLNAIHFVLLVLPVATDPKRRPRYDFLVYNASVTYWQIARQLMKKSTFQYLLPSLSAIVDALKAVGEKDILWLLQLQLAVVHAQVDAKQLASAAKTICDIVETQFPPLLSDPVDASTRALYEEALRLQVHVGSFKDPECQKMLAAMKKPNASKRTSLIAKLQALKSGAFAGSLDAALTELFQETTGMTSFAVATSTNDEIVSHLRGLDAASAQSVDAEILVESGIIAVFRQEYRHAACCDLALQTKGKTVDPRIRVLHQVLKAILVALLPPAASANFKLQRPQRAALVVARRLEGVKALERALLACKRQEDPTLMENVCLYAWNLSLPLLQTQVRDQLLRLYSLASSSLQELESLQLNLRVRLMLELAKLEVSADFVAKAQENVNHALGLDYGTITTTAAASPTPNELFNSETKWMRRPVDVHLLPLRRRLDAKLAVEDPANHDEELATAVEQLQEAKTSDQRRRQLDRVLLAVDNILAERQKGDDTPAVLSLDLLLHLNVTSAFVWHEMKEAAVAIRLTRDALRLFFSAATGDPNQVPRQGEFSDPSVMLLEVDLRLRLVELMGRELKARAQRFDSAIAERQSGKKKTARDSTMGSRKQPRKMNDDHAIDNAALLLLTQESHALGISGLSISSGEENDQAILDRRTALETELLALKMEVIQELGAALRAATRIGWGFVIENCAVHLWNYHFHIFRLLLTPAGSSSSAPVILLECLSAFEAALAALESLPTSTVNLDLLTSIALGIALVQERTGKLDKAAAIADGILKRHKASTAALPSTHVMAPSSSLVLLKRFGELKVRIQMQQNPKEILPVDVTPQVKVASFLEAMEGSLLQHQQATTTVTPPPQVAQLMEKALSFFHKALAAWQSLASESLDCIKSEGLTLEEQQQHLETYCELWVRLGCGAFRVKNAKQAMDCGERALVSITQVLTEAGEQRLWVTEATWKWLAIAELVCARSILTLLSGETAAWTLIEASLHHVVQSTRNAARAGAVAVLRKGAEVAWNAVLSAMAAVEAERAVGESSDGGSEADSWTRLLPLLREVLTTLGKSESGRFLGEFGLLVLDVCEKANDWKAATEVAESLMHTTSSAITADHMKDITTTHAIAVASLGDGSSGSGVATSGGKGKDDDPVVHAKIMRKIAFSSWRNPPAQLKALVTAHQLLDTRPEEQALVLMEMAEWFFTHHFPGQEVNAHLKSAMAILVHGQQKSLVGVKTGVAADTIGGGLEYTPLWYADKLIRVFTMQAVCASSMLQRWTAVGHAMHQIYTAWQCILDMANEADLRHRFAVEGQGDQAVNFDDWKVEKATKFETLAPHTVNEWVAFYQQHATSLSSRFFMPWLTGLKAETTRDSQQQSIANPILTGSALQRLLDLLAAFDAHELSLPVICLYQVIYHALCAHKCKTMDIWLELTMYEALEKLNLPVLTVPLQSALELLQSSGDAILKELQQQAPKRGEAISPPDANSRRRAVLQLSTVSVADKVAQNVELLLQFGFIRQAKVLLSMLCNVACRAPADSAMKKRCEALVTQLHVLEGDEQLALQGIHELHSPQSQLEFSLFIKLIGAMSEQIPDKHKALDKLLEGERLAASAIVSAGDCAQLHQPMHAQAVTKYLMSLASASSTSTRPVPPAMQHHNMTVDVDGICGLAQLKLRRACLMMDVGSPTVSVELAQGVFQEATELLECVDATNQLARLKWAFAKKLIQHSTTVDGDVKQQKRWLLDARSLLREALMLLEDVRYRTFELVHSTAPVRFTVPLELEIADLKLRLSALEMQLEESAEIVTDLQMTWYTYEKETRHNVIEKWLDQTATHVPFDRPGSVARAFVLASAVVTTLATYPDSFELRALTTVYRLRCERLALYQNASKDARETVHRFVWTQFTSTHGAHETWICAVSISGSQDNGRTTPSLPPTETDSAHANMGVQQQLLALTAELERELKAAVVRRHVGTLQVCSHELMQVYGCVQPLACAKAMLQYQSTLVRERHMRPLVERCLTSSNVTRLHMQRCEKLLVQHTNAPQNSLPFQLSQLYLDQQSDIYKRMNVCVDVNTILPMLPAATRVLSLQFSPNQCFLYAAVVSNSDTCVAMARMECTTAKLTLLSNVRERIRNWRRDMIKTLLTLEESNGEGAQQQDAHEFVTSGDAGAEVVDTDILDKEFDAIIHATAEFFEPLFAHSALASMMEAELPGNSLVLIVDRELELLPLEALPALAKADAITREFSLHLLYHRLAAFKTHPFRKDDVRIAVDPWSEDAGLHDQTLTSVVHQFTKKAGAVFANWKEAVDHGCVPTTTDWQQAMLLRKSGGLVYVGPNRAIGSTVSLPTLAGMNLASSCYALVLLDRAENQISARRQSKIDSSKTRWELELEGDPYACALLCSLCGVNAVVLNQWTTTFNANRRLATALLGGLAKGQSLARSLRKYPETVGPTAAPSPSAPPRKASTTANAVSLPTQHRLKNRIRFNTAVFGLGHMTFTLAN